MTEAVMNVMLDKMLKNINLQIGDEPFRISAGYLEQFKNIFEDEKSKQNIIDCNTKPVLGIDIYQYSQFNLPEQILIPVVFEILYNSTIGICYKTEGALFENFNYIDRFIPTGDGGFLIFDNLFQAVVFNINFHLMLRLFNVKKRFSELSNIVGEIIIRTCITYDFIYKYKQYDHNKKEEYYGTAIINNNRILSKDKLNRFLIDDNTYKWFLENIKGIENLQTVNITYIPFYSATQSGIILPLISP